MGDERLVAEAVAVPPGVVHPSGDGVHDDFHTRYRELYPATKDVAHFLAERQVTAGGGIDGERS